MDVNQCERTLGVFMGPSLKWERQFNEMVHKMKQAIAKLKNTTITTLVAYIYYNMYLLTKVYFGYSVINITKVQEQILVKVHEITILRKLRFIEKFPQRVLYSYKTALGISLIKLSTMIATLVLKL